MAKPTGPVYLVWDEADPESETVSEKLRYARYASYDDALTQAEHDLKTPKALKAMKLHMGKPDLADDEVPIGDGRRIVGIVVAKHATLTLEQVRDTLVWSPST